jgi:hypothetical protein
VPWIQLVASRPTLIAVLAGLKKDDRVTVSGEVLAFKAAFTGSTIQPDLF